MSLHHLHKPHYSVQKPQLVAISSQQAQWVRLAALANNLSNANTPGFKTHMIKLVQTTQKGKEDRIVSFVSASNAIRNLQDGSYRQTGNPTDVSLSGNGYFMVETAKGNRLTRNGQFSIDASGSLISSHGGLKILDQNQSTIKIPANVKHLIINPHGSIYADSVLVGKIGVFKVSNQQEQLVSNGNNLLDPLNQEILISDKYYIKQYGLEDSNVSPIQESLLMIEVLRQYEQAQKMIDDREQAHKRVMNVSPRNV